MARTREALLSGVSGLVIAVVFTMVVAQLIQPPWTLGGSLVAVGLASFFSGFFGRYYAE